jgi:hypothetical protein
MKQEVAILTIHQKDSLVGQLVCPDGWFNPVMDADENWIISIEEINASIYPDHEWIKDLPITDYVGPYVPPIPSGTTINE